MKRAHIVLLALVASVTLLFGCGGSGAAGSGSASSAQGSTSAASASSSAVEETGYVKQEWVVINGNLTKTISHEYDDDMREIRRTENGKVVHEWTYDGNLLVEEVDNTVSSGRRYTYSYEDGLLVHKETYQLGQRTSLFRTEDFEYDGQGRVIVDHWYNSQGEHVGDVTYAYNEDGSYSETHPYVDAPGETWTMVYDAQGRLLDNGQGRVNEYGEDVWTTTVTDANGNKVVITRERTYDSEGNLTHISSSDNYDIGGTANVYEVDYENERGKCVYSRRENSLLGGFEDHDVEEHFYLFVTASGDTFGREYSNGSQSSASK